MRDLIAYGRVKRAALGVSIQDVDAEDARAAGLAEIHGVKVGGYSGEDSPSRKAGIEPGDVIVSIDSRPVDRVSTLQRIVRSHKPNDVVSVGVVRFGAKKSFNVKLLEVQDDDVVASTERARGNTSAEGVSYDKLGIAVAPVPSELSQRSAQSEQFKRGLLVTDVSTAGPAYKKLIEERDIILEVINPAPRMIVTSQGELERALGKVKTGDYVTLLVYNLDGGQTRVESMRVQ
jgi:serine protease Do